MTWAIIQVSVYLVQVCSPGGHTGRLLNPRNVPIKQWERSLPVGHVQGGYSILAMSPLNNGKGHFLLDMYLLSNMVEGHCPVSNWTLDNVNIVLIEQLFAITQCLCLKTMENYSLNLRIELESFDIRQCLVNGRHYFWYFRKHAGGRQENALLKSSTRSNCQIVLYHGLEETVASQMKQANCGNRDDL